MLVVHAAWCPRCKELKRRFFDPALAAASERFVMVNLDQDAEPEGLRYGPDGQYIPRVLFLDPQGQLDAGLSNPGRSKYKYFYSPARRPRRRDADRARTPWQAASNFTPSGRPRLKA
jgi:protein-disulfide reductase (glutathione)